MFTEDLPSNERVLTSQVNDRLVSPLLPLAKQHRKKKKKPALIFGCKHLFFQKDFLLKTDIFESQYLVCVHRFSTDVPDAYFDLRAAVLVRQIVSVFLVGL